MYIKNAWSLKMPLGYENMIIVAATSSNKTSRGFIDQSISKSIYWIDLLSKSVYPIVHYKNYSII